MRPHAKNDLCFRRSPKLSFPEWTRYLDEIATAKKLDVNEIKVKLVECGTPGTTGATVSGALHLNLFYFFLGMFPIFIQIFDYENMKKSETIHGFLFI